MKKNRQKQKKSGILIHNISADVEKNDVNTNVIEKKTDMAGYMILFIVSAIIITLITVYYIPQAESIFGYLILMLVLYMLSALLAFQRLYIKRESRGKIQTRLAGALGIITFVTALLILLPLKDEKIAQKIVSLSITEGRILYVM